MAEAGRACRGELVEAVDRVGRAGVGPRGIAVGVVGAGRLRDLRRRAVGEAEGQVAARAGEVMREARGLR
jgi:hypothetical protein